MKLGNFGDQIKDYVKARRKYPKPVFLQLKKLLNSKKPKVLDLGCGTGISTRQLAEFFSVVGCDPDHKMLAEARKYKSKHKVKYILGSAEVLPFKDSEFDAVTAFASFHWFQKDEALQEIKRVLKPGGLLFVVNKFGPVQWGEGYRRVLIKATGTKIAEFRGGKYEPVKEIKHAGFSDIQVKEWKGSEIYSVPGVVKYVKSVSIWNSVPASFHKQAEEALLVYAKKLKKKKGKIERKVTTKVVYGRKEV